MNSKALCRNRVPIFIVEKSVDGRDLPHFAVFRLSRDIAVENIPKNRVRKSRQIAAEYGFFGGVSKLLVYFSFATGVYGQGVQQGHGARGREYCTPHGYACSYRI